MRVAIVNNANTGWPRTILAPDVTWLSHRIDFPYWVKPGNISPTQIGSKGAIQILSELTRDPKLLRCH